MAAVGQMALEEGTEIAAPRQDAYSMGGAGSTARHVLTDTAQTITTITTTIAVEGTTEKSLSPVKTLGGYCF